MDYLIILFRLLQMMSAYIFVIRIFGQLHHQNFISKILMTKIGTSIFLLIFLIHILPWTEELWRWIFSTVPILIFYFSTQIFISQREKAFQEKFIFCLDRLLVLLRTGTGLRTALEQIIEEENDFIKSKLLQIRTFVVFSQHKNNINLSSSLLHLIQELRLAYENPHQSIRRIENLRKKLKMEKNFRHKSGQVLFQMRLQSWIMAFLYIALLIFVLWRDHSRLHFHWLLLSLFMFLLGFLWMLNIGRRIKWKI